ncbi:helix-turn-helix domain-containing protein [Paenibacillus sp. UNC499MF]|uniref:helix-turn-helix domain-containing protein n=1 Tax=unclassified Paenibacillus TaxID=185978 RepID=UPI0008A080BB|nr:XRE family transcriptional regulator [Paenibacillus sp. UNC499MF]SEF92600.1 Cupin domain-containing protein [Paenibacillus sp. UNC499MF]
MDNMVERVAGNLKKIRRSRGLSLDKLAELTGVSKTMLAQIERAESNPTITILWKIAHGLHISVSALIEDEKPSVTLVKKSELFPMSSEEGKYTAYPLFPYDGSSRFEIYSVELQPGCEYESDPHHEGVEEYVSVTRGTLEMQIGGQVIVAENGDAIRFHADQNHIYRNSTDEVVHIQSVILYPF